MEMSTRARIRAGDPDTFGSLFDDYARAVYNHAFRLTGDWSAAEDVLSLTFLEAWRLRETVELTGGSLRPWLLGIATNTARNIRRAARRHEAAVCRLPRDEVFPDFAEDLIDRIDDAGQIALLQTALSRLRRAEREVVALCLWSGLDYVAAARALGIPVGTVRSRLSRARKKLRKFAGAEVPPGSGNPETAGSQADGDHVPVRRAQKETR
jgi:RNA polymerase sigma-70 factor (ECF subfamily)